MRTIQLAKNDITEMNVDAIVNAANNELWMGVGVAGAIKRKGGEEIEKEALQKSSIKHGSAIVTHAGKLKAKYVIHAAAMRSDGFINETSLKESIEKSLELAEKLKITSIAFPAIGTGVAGFSPSSCAKIMHETFLHFPYVNLKKIFLVLYNDEFYTIFLQEFKKEKIEL